MLMTSASVSAIRCRHTADPIKPAPPVTIKRIKSRFTNSVRLQFTLTRIFSCPRILPRRRENLIPRRRGEVFGLHTQKNPATRLAVDAADPCPREARLQAAQATQLRGLDHSREHPNHAPGCSRK